MHSLLIDLDGVLYEGDQPVAGAAEAVAWVQEQGVPHLFLTNTTSRPRSSLVDKLARMGITVAESDILTPPVAAKQWLQDHVSEAVVLFVPAATREEFEGLPLAAGEPDEPVGAVVIGDYGERWSFAELNRAFRLLMSDPQPALVALGMTRYWRAPDGLRLDTGPFVMALSHATGAEPVVLGKPAPPFFAAALAQLGASSEQTFMLGDDIRTDVAAAQDSGLRGILVRTGKYRPSDQELGIRPHAILESVAALPGWWKAAEPSTSSNP